MMSAVQRTVMVHLECVVVTPVDLVLSVAAAAGYRRLSESLEGSVAGQRLVWSEVADQHGTRLHHAVGVGPGSLVIDYRADVEGLATAPADEPIDVIRYLRPSRYCESDRLAPVARAEFAGLAGHDLLAAVTSWVGTRLGYVPGSSRPIDGATNTLLARQGVCRDFAHLVVALLRSCDVPARLASVYAPGLSPMDFHAVAEAYVDGDWFVVDATCLAPRETMVRIATGRDAADTAFLTTAGGLIELTGIEVVAYTDGLLPFDDVQALARLR